MSLLTGWCMVLPGRVLASEPTNRKRMVFACQVLASESANRDV